MSPADESAASKIEAALTEEPVTLDELCKAVFGRVGARERNVVRVNLHRIDERGELEKLAMRYRRKKRKKD